VPPNGAWSRWAAVARRHDADVGRGGPPLESSARSTSRGDTPATEDGAGALWTVGDCADADREDD
jgi:hypothetical protein